MTKPCFGIFHLAPLPGARDLKTHPELDRLAGYAIRYFDEFGEARTKVSARPMRSSGTHWPGCRRPRGLPANADGEAIQNAALNVARKIERYQDHSKQSPEGGPGVSVAFFQMIYQVLIGQERGPRFGSFAALYGIAETRALIGGRWLASWRRRRPRPSAWRERVRSKSASTTHLHDRLDARSTEHPGQPQADVSGGAPKKPFLSVCACASASA